MKRSLVFITLFFIIQNLYGYTILLDPGHGGEDNGATGIIVEKFKGKKITKTYLEKDLTLIYAKKLKERLSKKGFSVYLSRSFDHTVSLEKRAEIAETVKAEIMISIHMNSSMKRSSKGFEIYYLDNHKDAAVKKVEDLENKGLKGDQLIINQILTDLIIERTVKGSKTLAKSIYKNVERNIFKKLSVKGRGLRPGLFYVLALSKRPGALLEIGFMSNRGELKKLINPSFQTKMVSALANGIDAGIKKLKKL